MSEPARPLDCPSCIWTLQLPEFDENGNVGPRPTIGWVDPERAETPSVIAQALEVALAKGRALEILRVPIRGVTR